MFLPSPTICFTYAILGDHSANFLSKISKAIPIIIKRSCTDKTIRNLLYLASLSIIRVDNL